MLVLSGCGWLLPDAPTARPTPPDPDAAVFHDWKVAGHATCSPADQRCPPRRLRRAIFAPCLPSAVRVFAGRLAIVRFRRAAVAAFLILRRAALRCFWVAMTARSANHEPAGSSIFAVLPDSQPPLPDPQPGAIGRRGYRELAPGPPAALRPPGRNR